MADPSRERGQVGGRREDPGLQGCGDAVLDAAGDLGELGDDRGTVQAAALGGVRPGEEGGDLLQCGGGVGIEALGGVVEPAGGAAQHPLGSQDKRGAKGELEGVAAVMDEVHLGPSGQGLGGCLGQQRELDAIQHGPLGRQSEVTERLANRVGEYCGQQSGDRWAGPLAVDPAADAAGVRGNLPVTLDIRFCGDAAGDLAVRQAGGRDPYREVRVAGSAGHRRATFPRLHDT
ncbi:hypothetical protein [Streptomyces antimycoticus]|uniref:hypothetical protein n=1 Tax=Streptomyces antimycoticus TaxID=68175 RepID=UPI001374F7BC|nr:hypothetical protein [Streptomyces antimycoticus]